MTWGKGERESTESLSPGTRKEQGCGSSCAGRVRVDAVWVQGNRNDV